MRAFIDQFMGAGVAWAIVLVHVAALAWSAILRRGMTPALIVNLILSAAILAYNADHLGIMLEYADTAPLALTVYAMATFVFAACALCGLRIPAWINWSAFAVNFALGVLFLAFLATFRMTRLF